jgi:hypothetical protein
MATMSQYMLSSAATFGFFMSIGSVGLPLMLSYIVRGEDLTSTGH